MADIPSIALSVPDLVLETENGSTIPGPEVGSTSGRMMAAHINQQHSSLGSFEDEDDDEVEDDEEEGGGGGAAEEEEDDAEEGDRNSAKRSKPSRELPPEAVAVFKSWLLSEKNFSHPYPSPEEQERLLSITGLGKRQLKNWFTNARRRIWKPLVVQRLKALNKPMAFSSDADCDGVQRFDAERIFSLKPSARGAEVGGPGASGRMMRYVGFSPFEAVKQPSAASLTTPVGSGDDENLLVTISESENPNRAHVFEVPNETFAGPNPAATKVYRTILTSATAVASDARCLICAEDAVDSQLMPCRHLLHATCLRMWMQPKHGAPTEDVRNYNTCCPICSVGISCVVLAVPCVDHNSSTAKAAMLPATSSEAPALPPLPSAVLAEASLSQGEAVDTLAAPVPDAVVTGAVGESGVKCEKRE